MTNPADALIQKLETIRSDWLADGQEMKACAMDYIIPIVRQHTEPTASGDVVERVAVAMYEESRKHFPHWIDGDGRIVPIWGVGFEIDFRVLAKAAIAAMPTQHGASGDGLVEKLRRSTHTTIEIKIDGEWDEIEAADLLAEIDHKLQEAGYVVMAPPKKGQEVFTLSPLDPNDKRGEGIVDRAAQQGDERTATNSDINTTLDGESVGYGETDRTAVRIDHFREFTKKVAATHQEVEPSWRTPAEAALFYLRYSHGCWCEKPPEPGRFHSLGCQFAEDAMKSSIGSGAVVPAPEKAGDAAGLYPVERTSPAQQNHVDGDENEGELDLQYDQCPQCGDVKRVGSPHGCRSEISGHTGYVVCSYCGTDFREGESHGILKCPAELKDIAYALEKATKPVSVSLKKCVMALWDWEHQGRDNDILRIEFSLLKTDYHDKVKAVLDEAIKQGAAMVYGD